MHLVSLLNDVGTLSRRLHWGFFKNLCLRVAHTSVCVCVCASQYCGAWLGAGPVLCWCCAVWWCNLSLRAGCVTALPMGCVQCLLAPFLELHLHVHPLPWQAQRACSRCACAVPAAAQASCGYLGSWAGVGLARSEVLVLPGLFDEFYRRFGLYAGKFSVRVHAGLGLMWTGILLLVASRL
jgi:hypothetical protein